MRLALSWHQLHTARITARPLGREVVTSRGLRVEQTRAPIVTRRTHGS